MSTISDNFANSGGGINNSGTLTLNNTTLFGNSNTEGRGITGGGEVIDNGNPEPPGQPFLQQVQITWSTPANITYGTALSSTQLDASTTIAGSFAYTLADGATPASGVVLGIGQGQVLKATFTPTDTTDYATTTSLVKINVTMSQTISFAGLANRTYGAAPFAVSATASSGLAVSFSIVAGGQYASISGNTITLLGATPTGAVVTVAAKQAGNANYSAAPAVDRSFTIASQAVGVTSPLEGPAAGSDTDMVTSGGPWTAISHTSWLHTSSHGTGNGVATFTFDANTGPTRTGTLTIAGLTVPVVQAGSNYVGVSPLTTVVSSGLNSPTGIAVSGRACSGSTSTSPTRATMPSRSGTPRRAKLPPWSPPG